MNQQSIKKNTTNIKLGVESYPIIDKVFFEKECYPEKDVRILGTINLADPLPLGAVSGKGIYINNIGYAVTDTYPAQFYGYYQINQTDFVRVENVQVMQDQESIDPIFSYRSPLYKKGKERKPVIFIECEDLLCDSHEFGYMKKKPKINADVIKGCKNLKKAGFQIIILERNTEVEKGSCSYSSFKSYMKNLLSQFLLKGLIIDAIYIAVQDINPEILIQHASDDCFLAAKKSAFIGHSLKWNQYTKGSTILPQILVNKELKKADAIICGTFDEACALILSGEYLNKKKRKITKKKTENKTSIPKEKKIQVDENAEQLIEEPKNLITNETKEEPEELIEKTKPKEKEIRPVTVDMEFPVIPDNLNDPAIEGFSDDNLPF